MNYDDIWLRNKVTNLGRDLEDLSKKVEFQNSVLQNLSTRLAMMENPRWVEPSARDAYLEAINIVTKIRMDAFAPSDEKSKRWVDATLNDILRALQDRLEKCGGKP